MNGLLALSMLIAGYLLLDLAFAAGFQLRGKPASSLSCFHFSPKFRFTAGPFVDLLLVICFFGGGAGIALARQGWPVWLAGLCGGFVGRAFATVVLLGSKALKHIAEAEEAEM